jgi:hypothetical protein
MPNKSKIKAPPTIKREDFAKYSSNSIEFKRMTHSQFINFVEFILKQPNVNDGENIRGTLGAFDKLKNKKYSSNRELIDIITYMFIYLLLFGVFVYLLVVIAFFIAYRQDVVKRTIGFQLLGIVCSALLMLLLFWWLLMRIVQQFKNIIFLI